MKIPNPPLQGTAKTVLISLNVLIFGFFILRAALLGSQWVLDACFGTVVVVMLGLFGKWLRIGVTGYILLSFGYIIHNLGTFELYAIQWTPFIGYDTVVHVVSGFAAGYVVFNFVAGRLHVRKGKVVNELVVDSHRWLIFLLVFSFANLLGTGLELLEFSGSVLFEPGEGMFLAGDGDQDTWVVGGGGDLADTMTDIMVNLFGSFLGALAYLLFTYDVIPWKRYAE